MAASEEKTWLVGITRHFQFILYSRKSAVSQDVTRGSVLYDDEYARCPLEDFRLDSLYGAKHESTRPQNLARSVFDELWSD